MCVNVFMYAHIYVCVCVCIYVHITRIRMYYMHFYVSIEAGYNLDMVFAHYLHWRKLPRARSAAEKPTEYIEGIRF